MPRAAKEISESGRFHIMLRGINKQNIFENDEDKEKYMSILTEYKEKCGFGIYGFCLMNNHIHLLIKTGAEPLESIFKKPAANMYNRTDFERKQEYGIYGRQDIEPSRCLL